MRKQVEAKGYATLANAERVIAKHVLSPELQYDTFVIINQQGRYVPAIQWRDSHSEKYNMMYFCNVGFFVFN